MLTHFQLNSVCLQVQAGTSIWIGMERDHNGTNPRKDLYWKRFDGYKRAFDFSPFAAYQTNQIDYLGADYIYFAADYLNDWWDSGLAMVLCEYGKSFLDSLSDDGAFLYVSLQSLKNCLAALLYLFATYISIFRNADWFNIDYQNFRLAHFLTLKK